jgi:hypothetical protein
MTIEHKEAIASPLRGMRRPANPGYEEGSQERQQRTPSRLFHPRDFSVYETRLEAIARQRASGKCTGATPCADNCGGQRHWLPYGNAMGLPHPGIMQHRLREPPTAWAPAERPFDVTKERLLAALDKPRTTYSVLMVVNPGGSVEEVQLMLMQMRDEGLVKFAIAKGHWSRA